MAVMRLIHGGTEVLARFESRAPRRSIVQVHVHYAMVPNMVFSVLLILYERMLASHVHGPTAVLLAFSLCNSELC
jgi:hypothetical protein